MIILCMSTIHQIIIINNHPPDHHQSTASSSVIILKITIKTNLHPIGSSDRAPVDDPGDYALVDVVQVQVEGARLPTTSGLHGVSGNEDVSQDYIDHFDHSDWRFKNEHFLPG